MPRGRTRREPDADLPPPITSDEARRRGLWAVLRLGKGHVTIAGPLQFPDGFTGPFAVDELAARRVAEQMARDDRYSLRDRRPVRERPPTALARRGRRGGPHAEAAGRFPCGHLRTRENTYQAPVRGRQYPACRECRRRRANEYYHRRKARSAPQGGTHGA